MPKHALLSASASKQWLNCPPSAKLCAEQEDRASPYAQQGTDAHELCEYKPGMTRLRISNSMMQKWKTARRNIETM